MLLSAAFRRFFRPRVRLAATAAFLCLPLMLQAQKAPAPAPAADNSPRYDAKTEETLKGTVDDVRVNGTDQKTKTATLVLKHGNQSVDVFLGPVSFLDAMEISFSKGDELQVVGSRVKDGDTEEVLAREVTKGNDTLILREKGGKPVW